jgi:hypothetical protein
MHMVKGVLVGISGLGSPQVHWYHLEKDLAISDVDREVNSEIIRQISWKAGNMKILSTDKSDSRRWVYTSCKLEYLLILLC